MDAERIKDLSRIAAVEYMVCNLYSVLLVRDFGNNAPTKLHELFEELREQLRMFTVPGLDAAISDHIAAEQEDSFLNLLTMTEEMIQNRLAALQDEQQGR